MENERQDPTDENVQPPAQAQEPAAAPEAAPAAEAPPAALEAEAPPAPAAEAPSAIPEAEAPPAPAAEAPPAAPETEAPPAAPGAAAPAAEAPRPRPSGPRPERDEGDRDGRPGGDRRRRFGRRKVCAFCVEKAQAIDYKDAGKLRRYLSDRGRIDARRKTGTCAKHQRWLATALKRARHLALLPYTPEHIRASGIGAGRR